MRGTCVAEHERMRTLALIALAVMALPITGCGDTLPTEAQQHCLAYQDVHLRDECFARNLPHDYGTAALIATQIANQNAQLATQTANTNMMITNMMMTPPPPLMQ
jgi:hypothetical protein